MGADRRRRRQGSQHSESHEAGGVGSSASPEQALRIARRRLDRRVQASERRTIRALARRYRRDRHLDRLMGWGLVLPDPPDARLTGRLIRALGHLLHEQVARGDHVAERQVRRTRIALFGECHRWRAERRQDGTVA